MGGVEDEELFDVSSPLPVATVSASLAGTQDKQRNRQLSGCGNPSGHITYS